MMCLLQLYKCLQTASKCLCVIFMTVAVFVILSSYHQAMMFSVVMDGPLSPDDPRLLSYIKSRLLVPPGSGLYDLRSMDRSNPANLRYNNFLYMEGFLDLQRILKAIFDDQPPGFFVEAGALDGEYLSNTLYLEKGKGWKGLLVEPDSKMFTRVLKKNRKAWASNCCLATDAYPKKEILVTLSDKNNLYEFGHRALNALISSSVATSSSGLSYQSFNRVQCVPLQSLLQALEVSHVDFVSLDLEGVEEDILKTFFGNKKGLEVDVWVVENLSFQLGNKEKNKAYLQMFSQGGYTLYTASSITAPTNFVFIRNDSVIYQSAFDNRPQEFAVSKILEGQGKP